LAIPTHPTTVPIEVGFRLGNRRIGAIAPC
jgi:hypothetical protein